MLNILGATALAYLAGSGTVTNTAVVGRGVFRAACRAFQGRYDEAAVEALAALAAPALMSYGATASLVMDAIDAARDLAGPAFEAVGERLPRRDAA
jgi:hypothetical protein